MSTVQALAALSDAAARDAIARVQAQAVQRDVCHLGKCIRWRRFGEGSPLVLLHGGHGSWMHWLRNVEALAQQHTVWVPDMPGFNDSDALDPVPHGQDRMAPLIDALRATLDILIGGERPLTWRGFHSADWSPHALRQSAARCAGWRFWVWLATAQQDGNGKR